MNAAQLVLGNRRLAWIAMLGVVAWGAWAGWRMVQRVGEPAPAERATIFTSCPGADAQTVEQQVTRRIEAALSGHEGIATISSTSRAGVSRVSVELRGHGRHQERIWDDLRGRLAAIGDLPRAGDDGAAPRLFVDEARRTTLPDESRSTIARLATVLAVAVVIAIACGGLAGWRTALVLVSSLVVGVACTTGVCGALRVRLSDVSLGAMILGLGFIVADVLSSVDAIARELAVGRPRGDAMSLAMAKLVRPGVFATLLALAVILPLVTIKGEAGAFLRPAVAVLAASVVAGRVVSMIFVPLQGGVLRGRHGLDAHRLGKGKTARLGVFGRCAAHPLIVGVACAVLIAAGVVALARLSPRLTLTPTSNAPAVEVRLLGPEIGTLRDLADDVSHDLYALNGTIDTRQWGASDNIGPDLHLIPAEIRRYDGQRCLVVECDAAPGILVPRLACRVRAQLAAMPLPAGYRYELAGRAAAESRSLVSLAKAGAIALAAAYLLLVIQLNSFARPLAALMGVVLATVGGLPLLLLDGSLALTGVVALAAVAGLILSHSSMLLATIESMRAEGRSAHEAAVAGTLARLRPSLPALLAALVAASTLAGDGGSAWAGPAYMAGGAVAVFLLAFVLGVPAIHRTPAD